MSVFSRRHVNLDLSMEPKLTRRRELRYYGFNACEAVARLRREDIIRVYITDKTKREFADLVKWCAAQRKAYHLVQEAELEKISHSVHHEGVCLLALEPAIWDAETLYGQVKRDIEANPACAILYLDEVRNPHNIGAIARTAANFGCRYLVGKAGVVPELTPAAIRTAEGGFESCQLTYITEEKKFFADFKKLGFDLVGLSSRKGDSLYETTMPEKSVFVLGNEMSGLSPEVAKLCTEYMRIPGTGAVESLNVSVANAVILGEYWRQWKKKR
ncbi:MAG: TrmH family RNA methyltransferase [Oligoflexales bacterium]